MRANKLIAGLGLLCGAVGCHHTAGFCDCMPNVQPCAIYGMYPAVGYNQVPVVAMTDANPAVTTETPKAERPAAATIPATDPVKEKIDLPKESEK